MQDNKTNSNDSNYTKLGWKTFQMEPDGGDVSVVGGLVSDGSGPVGVGVNRVIQVFITHSASVFMVDYPPVVVPAQQPGEHLVRLEDQVRR